MKNIKLYIGEKNYSQNKTAWIPTIDSVLNTQRFMTSRFLHRTVIIFRKSSMQDISYSMTNSVCYSTSEFDSLIVHNGSTGSILINENAYYFDGTYYYYYLVMYSNTFNLWNVVNNNSIYAVLYDQTNVVIQGGASYIMNEFRITSYVRSLLLAVGDVTNVTTLIIPNQTFDGIEYATYSGFSNLEYFQLFNMGYSLSNQEVSVYKGLLYTAGNEELIAVPSKYPGDTLLFRSSRTTSTTSTKKIHLHSSCILIRNLAFNDDSSGNVYSEVIDEISGDNVQVLDTTALAYTNIKSIYFPSLTDIKSLALAESAIEKIYLPNTLNSVHYDFVEGCSALREVIMENNFNCSVTFKDANAIDPLLLGQQFYHLLPQNKDYPKTITVMPEVYNNIPQADIDYAVSINWIIAQI